MRFAVALVVAVALAGYLERPVAPETFHATAREDLDPWFPRALGAAQTWRAESVPARIVGEPHVAPPPEGVPHVDVPSSRTRSASTPTEARLAADGAATYAFLDAASGDLALVTVTEATTSLRQVADAPRPPPDGALDGARTVLGAVVPIATAPLDAAAPPESRVAPPAPARAPPADAACDGWWVCLRVALAAWWG